MSPSSTQEQDYTSPTTTDLTEFNESFVDLSTDEKLMILYRQNLLVIEQYARVEAMVTETLGSVSPMLEKMAKSPALKMLGFR